MADSGGVIAVHGEHLEERVVCGVAGVLGRQLDDDEMDPAGVLLT